jgi:hypothetical protein
MTGKLVVKKALPEISFMHGFFEPVVTKIS